MDQAPFSFEDMLSADPDLCARAERLERVLKPLDAWAVPSASPVLVERIMNRIAATQRRPIRPSVPVGADASEYGGRRPFLTLNELVAVAACITLLVGIAAPSVSNVRERARQVQCRDQLSSMFGAMQRYALANQGALPNLGVRPGEFWLATPEANGRVRPNSSHLVLLLRFGYLPDSRLLKCPSDQRRPSWVAVDWQSADRFPSPPSYNAQNVAGPTPPLNGTTKVALMADSNPLFMDGKFHEGIDPRAANSRTHHGKGQNVLLTDGSATWCSEPTIERDNIWQASDLLRYRGNEAQTSATDSFLVP
jgi:type II secretory pathway pseudopilin PulG